MDKSIYRESLAEDRDNFIDNINKLLNIGYSSDNINLIYKKLNDNTIDIIINKDKISDIDKYLNINYFKEENLDKYLNYNKNNLDIETIITYVCVISWSILYQKKTMSTLII